MQYVLKKSIEFVSLTENVFIPAGAIITVDVNNMVGYFAGHHFDVERHEIVAIH